MTVRKSRIKCSKGGRYHVVEIHPDGRVLSHGCGDITRDVNRIAALIRLGKSPPYEMVGSCDCFAALILHGCELLLRRPADDNGYITDLAGWNDIYVRFELNKLVERQVELMRLKIREEEKTTSHWSPRSTLKMDTSQ